MSTYDGGRHIVGPGGAWVATLAVDETPEEQVDRLMRMSAELAALVVTADEEQLNDLRVVRRVFMKHGLAVTVRPPGASTTARLGRERCGEKSPSGHRCSMKEGHPGRHGWRGVDYWGQR